MSVLIYAQNWDGKFKKSVYELLSYGKKIAENNGTELIALSLGNVEKDELESLANYGADKIYFSNNSAFESFDNEIFTAALKQTKKLLPKRLFCFITMKAKLLAHIFR